MSKFEVPFIKPHLPPSSELAEDYEKIVESNWFTNFGPFENKFRRAVEQYLGDDIHVTTVANATLGIDLALRSLVDVEQRGKGIIMPSFTFAAGAEVIIANGLTPVFIDINEDNLQPKIEDARSYLQSNRSTTAGILLCNIFGVGNKAIDEWEVLAKEYDLPLIIDTAAGFGSEYQSGEKVGARGDCEVFSLHATKPFAVGEGGLVSSRDEALINKIRQLQNFGFGQNRDVVGIGTNAKMQEINAAIGLRQLQGFEDRLAGRRIALEVYKMALGEYAFQDNDKLSTVAFASAIALDSSIADRNYENLLRNGIEARRYYRPLHFHRIIAQSALYGSDLKTTENIASRILSLPVHDNMDIRDIQRIIDCIE